MANDLPTKKQKELLSFIDGFIKGNGYGPSYRETMRAMGYKSVSTVATHIDNLIVKGYLVKRDYSARSLEVTTPDAPKSPSSPTDNLESHHQWLRDEIAKREPGPDVEVLTQAASILDVDLPTPEA